MKKFIIPALLFYFGCECVYGQAGRLDPTFGINGIVKTNIGSSGDYQTTGSTVIAQPDGGIYMVLLAPFGIQITKRFADGSTDTSYGNYGFSNPIAIHGRYVPDQVPPHAALQPDGKLVVAGILSDSFAIARFNTDGTLDYTFGTYGIAMSGDGQKDVATSVAIAADGRIIVAGYSYNEDNEVFISQFALLQFSSLGIPEHESFSDSGGYLSIAIQDDGKIIAAGFLTHDTYGSAYAVARYNSDLSFDSSFFGEGVRRPFNNSGSVNAIVIQDDGKIVVAGSTIVRYNIDGSNDNTFNGTGIVRPGNEIFSVIIQTNGKIVAAGDDFTVYRYNLDGSADKTFNKEGRQSTDFGSAFDRCYSITLQTDGKIIAIGSSQKIASPYRKFFAAARYNADGSVDDSFGSNGTLTGQVNQGNTLFYSPAVQSDGKVLAAGNTFNGNDRDFVIVRYNTDGSTDHTFSVDGLQITDFDSTDDFANSIVIQSDGKILVGGSSAGNFALARYNADGSFDATFSGDGLQTTDFGQDDFIKKLVLQSDGKILAGGSGLARYNSDGSIDLGFSRSLLECDGLAIQNDGKILVTNQHDGFSLYRYNADGSTDYTFGDGGIVSFSDDADGAVEGSIAIQDDGKIVVGGSLKVNSHQEDRSVFVLVRFNGDGSRDLTFNGGELVTTRGYEGANALQIQGDHKIILGGVSYSTGDFALARYQADGSLDTSFNGGFFTTSVSPKFDEITDIAVSGNKLYAVGHGQFPANYGIVSRYLLSNEILIPPTVSMSTPGNNATYLSGGNIYLKAVATDADGTISKVEFYNGNTLLGIATDTPYTFRWEHVLKGNYVLFAKAIDNDGLVNTSDSISISVVPNKPPIVHITNPADGSTFLKGATLHLLAAASDTDGRIEKVEFYSGSTLLVSERKEPYTFDWRFIKTGNYSITAKATDNWGAVSISAAINISVVLNESPNVSIVAPFNGQIFTAGDTGANITLEAAASDPDGRIVQVRFFEGSTLLTNEHKMPYAYQWQNVPEGTHTLTAIARDNWGAETWSAPVTVTVEAPAASLRNTSSFAQNKVSLYPLITLHLAPNPVDNVLNINIGSPNIKVSKIWVLSVSGVVLKTSNTIISSQSIQLDVATLPRGTYILKIKNGDAFIYRRFVKM